MGSPRCRKGNSLQVDSYAEEDCPIPFSTALAGSVPKGQKLLPMYFEPYIGEDPEVRDQLVLELRWSDVIGDEDQSK
jgi:hypothetical protein